MRFFTPALLLLGASARVSYCQAQKCENHYHGGWGRVRHVPAGDTWHPATDDLAGTDEYGVEGSDEAAWSVKFSSKVPENCPYEEFLFATGDCTKWLVATVDAAIGERYDGARRPIISLLGF